MAVHGPTVVVRGRTVPSAAAAEERAARDHVEGRSLLSAAPAAEVVGRWVVGAHPAKRRGAMAVHGPAVMRRRTAAFAPAAAERAARAPVDGRSVLSFILAAEVVGLWVVRVHPAAKKRAAAVRGSAVVRRRRRRTVPHAVGGRHAFLALVPLVTRATRAMERSGERSVARRAAEEAVAVRRRSMLRRAARPTQHSATATTRTGTTTLLVRDAVPAAEAATSRPGAKKGLALNQSQFHEAVRAEAKGAKKRPGFAGPELDAGGSQGRVDGALAVFGLDDTAILVAVALAAAIDAVRDLARVLLVLLVDLGITAAAADAGAAAVVQSVVDQYRSGILTLQELPGG